MAMSRARRAELQRRAREIRLACQRSGMTVEKTCTAILDEVPQLLPLEAWRLAYGWSRAQSLSGIAGLYRADGLAEPPVSSAMLCRWEHGQAHPDPEYGHVLCRLYSASPAQLGLRHLTPNPARVSSPATPAPVVTVSGGSGDNDESGEDPMRRRTLMAAAGLSVPLHLLAVLDDALALSPSPAETAEASQIKTRLAAARRQYDAGTLTPLVSGLPDLLSTAQEMADRAAAPAAFALLAACYDMATEALNKIGRGGASRITADRSTTWAARSGSPVAMAASARALGIVLRHEGRPEIAERVTLQAAGRLETTGLRTPAQSSAYVRMLCTCAYNAAQANDRDRALELIGEAERTSRVAGAESPPPQVTLYRVGVHWALGDAGTALHAGRNLQPGQFPTAERRGRLHTDMARAWWQWGKPEETAQQLLAAYSHAPSEVRDRPAIRRIADDLAALHPRVSGV
ncbi:MAG: Transcriptional regulator, contains XRE-family domain, partial [Nocardioides sp.]|nr:Transcriptional regulator, contains XRE-family domain [Nocardioides sp.]